MGDNIFKKFPLNKKSDARQFLLRRFRIPLETLSAEDLLEMVLAFVIDREVERRRVMRLLLKKLGSLGNVMNTDPDRLRSIDGISPKVVNIFYLFQEVMARLAKESFSQDSIDLKKFDDVEKYCRNRLGHMVNEKVLVLFLDARRRLIDDIWSGHGKPGEVRIDYRTVISKAVLNGASSIIVVHNHPAGSIEPSAADINVTFSLRSLLQKLSLELLDHIIITGNKSFSFHREHMLDYPPFD
jgi:DNA repair protein RadC